MPRYIDADYLLRELSFYADRPTKRAMDCVKGYALISDPDVLKVVRCKDCKHWKDSDGVYRRGVDAESKCPLNLKEVYEGTFYCGRAERREKEDG